MNSNPFLVERPGGYYEYQVTISQKAVIIKDGLVPLLKNERNEWELPGGKLELGEAPRDGIRREILEELAWDVEVGEPFQSWVYQVKDEEHTLVLTYAATYYGNEPPRFSHEHKDLVMCSVADVEELNMPRPYKEAIRTAAEASGVSPPGVL